MKFWILPAIGLIGAVYGVIRLVGDATNAQYKALHEAIEQRKATARARIVETAKRGKGISAHYLFTYKGVVYDSWQSDYNRAFVLRKCYEVWLDSANPARSFLVEGSEGSCGE